MHIDDPGTAARTIFVDTFKIKATHFDITADEQQKLFASGQAAAKKFLQDWDFKKWQGTFLRD
jgi:NTE family protein